MKFEEGFFAARDGTEIFYRLWHGSSQDACLLIHGYGDHSERYQELVESLSALNFSFFALDMRGQGRSKGRRVDASGVDAFADDCEFFLQFLKQRGDWDGSALYLLGHSFGAIIALRLLERDQNRWRGLILSSPCFALYGLAGSRLARWFANMMARVAPTMILRNHVFPRYLFRDPVRLLEYAKDPYVERRICARLAREILNSCLAESKRHVKLSVPVLVLASGDDRIVSLPVTESWFRRLESPIKKMKVFPGFYHEIFNEIERAKPIEELKSFLSAFAGGEK